MTVANIVVSVLLAGLWWSPLGVAATAGLVLYFALAIAAHVRAHDSGNTPMPMLFLALAAAALVLHLQ